METEIIVTGLGLLGSGIGAFTGIIVSTKLTNYRLLQLEKKVEEHNSVIKRTFVIEEQMKVANHRLSDLERGK